MGLLDKKDEPKPEVVISPVGATASKKTNKVTSHGFIQGQEVSEKDYFASIAKARLNKK